MNRLFTALAAVLLVSKVLSLFSFKFTRRIQYSRSIVHMTSLDDSISTTFYKSLEQKLLQLDEFQEVNIPDIYRYNAAQLMKSNVEFSCRSYKGNRWIRYLRIVKFVGENYDILNIMAAPYANNSLPILGIDTVALPGNFIFSISFQLIS